MRIESSITSISWIPSEAIKGAAKLPFEMGITHYDDPPPEAIEDLEAMATADAFREANELRGWIEVEDGRIADHGHAGKAYLGVTRVKLGPKTFTFPAVAMPTLQPDPEVGDGWVRFVQTAGGRTALPAPRRVKHKPYIQLASALAWTTLALTIHADGSSEHELVGASPFPRHWIYDHSGKLIEKSGVIDFGTWYRESFGAHTPWGDEDSAAVVAHVESTLERALSASIMRGAKKPQIRKLKAGEVLVVQDDLGTDQFLILDGMLTVERDREAIAEVGPGAILGEMALLEGGRRTATLRAASPCKIAVIPLGQISMEQLTEIARGRG
jgi:hypothetical protein